jgi:GNAT superfamily N-acetyltransferase
MRLETGQNDAAADEITERIIAFNLAHLPAPTGEETTPAPLHIFAYDDNDQLVGGVTAHTHTLPFWLEVSVLWVDETQRGQGLGSQLMRQAEQEALARGCRYARLATSHYQAPGFYAKLGYLQYGYLENCPPGEHVTYFWKPLGAEQVANGVE